MWSPQIGRYPEKKTKRLLVLRRAAPSGDLADPRLDLAEPSIYSVVPSVNLAAPRRLFTRETRTKAAGAKRELASSTAVSTARPPLSQRAISIAHEIHLPFRRRSLLARKQCSQCASCWMRHSPRPFQRKRTAATPDRSPSSSKRLHAIDTRKPP